LVSSLPARASDDLSRFACFLDGAAAIAHDASPKIQRYHGGNARS